VHPHASGFAHRVRLLEDFLQFMSGHDGLWNATGAEIAAHWRAQYVPETHLWLETPIWRDYPGSLS
jgi:hypothetical protein